MNFKRAADCLINDIFTDTSDPEFHRNSYCEKNCCFKCIKDQEYKKRKIDQKEKPTKTFIRKNFYENGICVGSFLYEEATGYQYGSASIVDHRGGTEILADEYLYGGDLPDDVTVEVLREDI